MKTTARGALIGASVSAFLGAVVGVPTVATADEGGVSFLLLIVPHPTACSGWSGGGSSFDEGQRPSHGPRCGHQYDRGCEHQTQQTE